MAIATGLPAGVHEGVPAEFGWSTTAPGPFTLVVFDAAYREIARREDLAGTHFATPSDWRELLAAAGTFHWQVFTTAAGQPLRSLCEQVEIR